MNLRLKRFLSILLAAVLVLSMLPISAFAKNAETTYPVTGSCGESLAWSLDENGTLTISGTGEMGDSVPWNSYKDSIKNVVIEDGVTSIGSYAFSYCKSLTSVTIGSGVTSIGKRAFSNCTGLTSITIPDSVTSIGEGVFSYCESLTSVTIPNSVTSISEFAFTCCEGLTSITIPNSVTSIGNRAFSNCTGLTSITIPNSVKSIGNWAFTCCEGLTSITIPDSVTNIGIYAFFGCTGLTSIAIPDSVTSIGEGAFSGCTGLTSVGGICGENLTWFLDEQDTLTISGEGEMHSYFDSDDYPLPYSPWYGMDIKKVVINDGTTSIGSNAFKDCTGLTSVTIGSSLTSIGAYAFENCTGLTNITIPDGVTDICRNALYNCVSLTSVTIPNSVISIREAAFKDCESLSDVYYAGTAEDWAKISIDIDNSKLLAANRHYKSTGPKIRWSYANGTLTIGGNGLMEECYNISSGRPWDKYKEKITRVVVENGVTNIGSWAFYGYTGLKSVTIPNSVTNIGEFSFYGCAGLVGITIPDSVENIDDWAFRNCTGVKGITFNGKIPNMGSGAFDGVSNCTANYLCGKGSSLNYAAEAGGDITWKIIHTGNKIIDAAVSATYDKTGLTEGSHCSVCNEVITKQKVVPMKLVAAPKKVKAQSAGYASVRISWGKVSYATGYAVYRATSKKGTYKYIGKTSKNYYTDAKRTTGTTYYYKVRAYRTVNKANKYGAYSAIVYAKALPATPVLTAKNAGTRKIKLSWKKISGAHGYEIYRATSKNGKYALAKRVTSGSTLSFTNTRLTRGKTYYYKIRAYRTVKRSRKYGAFSTVKYAKG